MSDLEWLFHASRSIAAVAELLALSSFNVRWLFQRESTDSVWSTLCSMTANKSQKPFRELRLLNDRLPAFVLLTCDASIKTSRRAITMIVHLSVWDGRALRSYGER